MVTIEVTGERVAGFFASCHVNVIGWQGPEKDGEMQA